MNNGNEKDYEIMSAAKLPTEPSSDYFESLEMFDSVLKESILLSKNFAGIPSPSGRHFYSSVLFTALIVRGVSLVNLAPHSSWNSKVIEHWDYATCSNIARTMLEIRLCFYYLCIEPCDKDEWDCRWNILNLHDCTARIRLFTALENQDEVTELSAQAEELKQRLLANPFFINLKNGEQRKYLNGQTAYMQPLEEIAEKVGIERPRFRWLYTFLSSHVHALPLSFYRIGNSDSERGRGLPSPIEESYTSMCLSLACKILKDAGIELTDLFKDLKKTGEDNDIEAMPDLTTDITSKIGEHYVIYENDILKVTILTESESKLITKYIYKKHDSLVLEQHIEDNNQFIVSLDPTFWRIDENGKPITFQQLDDYLNGKSPFAYQIDHENFCIRIKTS